MAHEIHDDGFHEIQLSGKQLVFLFMATTVVSIVIFLCGVLVGRGVQYARGGVAGAAGLASDAVDGSDDDAAATPASGEPTPLNGLSYPESLRAGDGAPAPVAAGAASDLGKATPSVAPPPTAAAAAPVPPPAVVASRDVPQDAPAPKAAPPAAPPSSAPAPAEDGGFTVQVTALKNKPEADAIAQRLQTRGYKAYVVAPAAGGQVIYKVRVGVNMQRQEADKVMRRLQNEEKFKPWITR
jgi:cell division septation protein DedD